ncbi:hypothetical protein [Sinorhizobium fredii]|uniref:hypothetical protein n=1 Tax=Rhizobium fredii TaxID=380 RepID=UPI0035197754
MAKATTKTGKSETLTIRLDPKTRFILEFMSRVNGQTITTVVERAIVSAASKTTVSRGDEYDADVSWQDLWDVSEGVRALRLAKIPGLYPTYEEEKRLAFAEEHWPFFYSDTKKNRLLNFFVDVLWPRLDEFVQMHDDKKHEDYFAAGKAMQEALKGAKMEPPEWPPQKKPKSTIDLTDDIPF